MDRVTVYKYALGSEEELRNGEFDSMDVQEEPSQLVSRVLNEANGLLILPRFIGIYQESEIISHTKSPEEREAVEIARKYTGKWGKVISELAGRKLASTFGVSDDVHPSLIALAYNDDIWTPDLVRQSIGDKLSRVMLSPVREIPNFYRKDVTLPQVIFDKGQEVFEVESDKDSVFESLRPEISEFEEQAKLYGLTREEYTLLKVLKRTEQNHPVLSEN